MAQVITAELEAILASKLQVGADKPRAEIEIDWRSSDAVPVEAGTATTPIEDDPVTGITVPVPAHDDGDFLLLCIHKDDDDGITAATVDGGGWTSIGSPPWHRGDFFWRVADSEPASYDISWGSARRGEAWIVPFKGVDTGDPIVDTDFEAPDVDFPIVDPYGAELTLAAGSYYLVASFEQNGGDWIYSAPTDWSLLAQGRTGSGASHDSSAVLVGRPFSGTATGTVAIPSTGGTVYGLTMFALRLAATGAGITEVLQVASIDLDRSRKMAAAQLDVLIDNEASDRGWYQQASPIFTPNNPIRAYAWLGDVANRVCIHTGLLDRVAEHRNPKQLALKSRSRMKWLLEQGFKATAPQSADDPDAVRTEDNGVYLGKTIEYIVGDILDRAGWPSADRAITATGITLAEYDLADGSSWADCIAGSDRLTTAAGYDMVEDELGVFRFEPSPLIAGSEPDPAWAFAAGVNVLTLDHETDDEDRATRVEVSGPMTSSVPIWDQTWSTSVLDHPAGAWYDPADPDYIRVIDRVTKRIYRMKQSDRSIASSHYLGGYPLGLSGDPTDATHYYVLHAPWRNTGSTSGNSIRQYLKADDSLVSTSTLPNGRWSDFKFDGTHLWLSNYDDGKLYKKTYNAGGSAGAVASYTIVDDDGETQTHMTGLWLDGTTLGLFFQPHKRFLLVDTSDPATVTGVQSTKGTRIAGGELDTDTDTDLYAVAGKGSFGLSEGMVAKFALAELVTKDVTALAVDYDLEDELGLQSGIAARDHDGCPNDPSPHPYEARLATYAMKVVQSLAQAGDVADAQLALRSRLRRQLDLATTGHPGVQLNDPVSYTDAIHGQDGAIWIIDTSRARIAATYTQTMSLLPYEAA